MPSEDQDQTWENDNEKSEFESIFLKFQFPTNIFEQADPTTSWTQKGIEMFYDQDVPWLVRKGSRYEVRKREYGMTNSHNCRSDHTVELVEQLQIRLPVENQTLEEESSTCEAVKIVDSFALFFVGQHVCSLQMERGTFDPFV